MLSARVVFLSGLVLSGIVALPAAGQPDPNVEAARAAFAASPVLFVENTGQFDPEIRFRTFGGGVAIDVLEDGLVFGPVEERVKVRFREAGPAMRLAPFGLQKTLISYYVGNDPERWRAGVRTWAGIRWEDVRTGLDLEVTGEGGTPQWRWVVGDESQPPEDALVIEGGAASALRLPGAVRPDSFTGAASRKTGTARTIDYQPITNEFEAGLSINAVAFDGANRLWFAGSGGSGQAIVGWLDVNAPGGGSPSRFLVFGGNDIDEATAIAAGAAGVAVAGYTLSGDFPLQCCQTHAQAQRKGVKDAFVVRVTDIGDLRGVVLVSATYAGGSAEEEAKAIKFCGANTADLCIAGWTTSPDLPLPAKNAVYHGQHDAFFLKVHGDLTAFIFSSYFGGSGQDEATALAVDPTTGRLVIAGRTTSADFPTSAGALRRTLRGPSDCFVANIGGGDAVAFATYLGGAADDACTGLVVDSGGFPIVSGNTTSGDLPVPTAVIQPTLSGNQDGFVARLTATMNGVSWLTYYGTPYSDNTAGLALDSAGRVYLVGSRQLSAGSSLTFGWLAVLSADAIHLLYSADLISRDFPSPLESARAVAVPGPVWVGGVINLGGGRLVRMLAPGTVSGVIWYDADRDGIMDTLEQLNTLNNYEGVTIANGSISSTLSGRGGLYSLPVRPSSPQICMTVPTGAITYADPCRTVNVSSFQTVSGVNFGLVSLLPNLVGVGGLAPSDASVRVLDPLSYRFSWTHPVGWRKLHTLDLLFVNDDQILIWLRFEQESNTFALFNPVSGQFGPRFPAGRPQRLETPYGSLFVPANAVDGPPGTTVAITIEARFKPQVAGWKLDILALAEDDNGTLQGPDSLGTVNVLPLR